MSTTRDIIRKTVIDVALLATSQVALWYAVRYYLGDDSRSSENDKGRVARTLEKLGRKGMKLSEHEKAIASEIVHPDDISVRFSDIGGLDGIVASLRESVIYPLLYPTLFTPDAEGVPGSSKSQSLFSAPKGVLLHGPPGCGKTLLARALAKESNATFINVPFSVLTNKWYGESNKLVSALFGLARKLQPSIIFIDEIDCFLRERGGSDHEVTGMMKAEFMTMWDGLLTAQDRIVVLGATNRPLDIDPAILRRMPKRFAVQLPDVDQRERILRLMLPESFASHETRLLAESTDGFSGSDLKEMCRDASIVPLREYMKERGGSQAEVAKSVKEGARIRPLQLRDFFADEDLSPLSVRARPSARSDASRGRRNIDEPIDNPGLD